VVKGWKKRLFQSFGEEVCYFKSAESEKMGSFHISSILHIHIVEENGGFEVHVVCSTGRTYLLKSPTPASSREEIETVAKQWRKWVYFVKKEPLAAEETEREPPAVARVPSLSLEPAGKNNPGKKDSPRKKESPRRIVSNLRNMLTNTSSVSSLSDDEEDSEGNDQLGMVLFSLLESLNPNLNLYFILTTTMLIGYADDSMSEIVEKIELGIDFID
jgi:hypothetical protein